MGGGGAKTRARTRSPARFAAARALLAWLFKERRTRLRVVRTKPETMANQVTYTVDNGAYCTFSKSKRLTFQVPSHCKNHVFLAVRGPREAERAVVLTLVCSPHIQPRVRLFLAYKLPNRIA